MEDKSLKNDFILPLVASLGCIVVMTGYLYFILSGISAFPMFLNMPPEWWWPKPHLIAGLILIAWALMGFCFLPRTSASGIVLPFIVLVLAGLFIGATALSATAGFAIYPDRIFIREYNGLLPSESTYYLRDVKRVELQCDQTTRHVHRGADRRMEKTVEYRLVFNDGRKINLTNAIRKREDYKAGLAMMTRIDRLMHQQGTPRHLSDAQSLHAYKTCVLLFRSDLNAYLNSYLPLFSPDAP